VFAVDRVEHARGLQDRAEDIGEKKLDEYFATAYGIFAGKANRTARSRSPNRKGYARA